MRRFTCDPRGDCVHRREMAPDVVETAPAELALSWVELAEGESVAELAGGLKKNSQPAGLGEAVDRNDIHRRTTERMKTAEGMSKAREAAHQRALSGMAHWDTTTGRTEPWG